MSAAFAGLEHLEIEATRIWYMDVKERVSEVISGIMHQAFSDGTITREERAMINQIHEGLTLLAQRMTDAEKSETVTDRDHERFRNSKAKILSSAWQLADMDNQITTDEEGILAALFHLLDELDLKQ